MRVIDPLGFKNTRKTKQANCERYVCRYSSRDLLASLLGQ